MTTTLYPDLNFARLIQEEPTDPLHCLAMADWLAEYGRDEESFAFRLMAKHGWRPGHRAKYRTEPGETAKRVPVKWSWCWWLEGRSKGDQADVPVSCELPEPILVAVMSNPFADHRYYPSWESAVADLVRGLAKLQQLLRV